MDFPLTPSISRSTSSRDRDRERDDDDDTDTLVDISSTTNTSSRSPRIRLSGYGTTTGLAASSSTSSFPLISSTSDSGSTSTAFLAPRLARSSSNPNPSDSALPTPSHSGTNNHAHSSSHSRRATSHSHQHPTHPTHEFLYPMDSFGHAGISSRSSAASVSMCSTAANSPINSRAGSPSPFFYSSTGSISSSDEDESEPPSPYLNSAGGTVGAWWREDSSSTSRRRWPWLVNGGGLGGLGTYPRRRRRMNGYGFRMFKRFIRRLLCRRLLVPKQPVMIVRIPSRLGQGRAQRSSFLAPDVTGSYSFRHIFDFPPGAYLKPRQGTTPVEILLFSPFNVYRPSIFIPFHLLPQPY